MPDSVTLLKVVANEMRELGYDVTEEQIDELLKWHRANPMPHNAALASNILIALEQKGVNTSP